MTTVNGRDVRAGDYLVVPGRHSLIVMHITERVTGDKEADRFPNCRGWRTVITEDGAISDDLLADLWLVPDWPYLVVRPALQEEEAA